MSEKEINRVVLFPYVQQFDDQDTSGKNNTWIYHRAPDGYLFRLHSVQCSSTFGPGLYKGIVAIFDGHEYTHWNIWPGVESREILVRLEHQSAFLDTYATLNGWQCKEYTIGIRSSSNVAGFKLCVIVWYYLEKASRDELLEYAIKHPKDEDAFKRALRGRTADVEEL